MNFEVQKAIFFVVASLLIVAYLVWALWGPVQRHFYRSSRWRVPSYYKIIRQVVLDHDFYLINDFRQKTAGVEPYHIDHIIIGEKYVYTISDRYFDGTLQANPDDEKWIYYRGNTKRYIDNPLKKNRLRTDRLILSQEPVEHDIFVPIVVVNDDCYFNVFDQSAETGYFVNLSRLGKLIAMKEKDPVSPLIPDMTAKLANDLAKMKNHD